MSYTMTLKFPRCKYEAVGAMLAPELGPELKPWIKTLTGWAELKFELLIEAAVQVILCATVGFDLVNSRKAV